MPAPLIGTGRTLLSGGRSAESPAARAARYGVVAAYGLADLADSFGTNTLTNNGVATFGAGKIGDAAYLVSALSQYLSVADNPSLAIGSGDGWGAIWGYHTGAGVERALMSKYNPTAGNREWILYKKATDIVWIDGSSDGAAEVEVASSFGALATATYYLLFFYHRNGVGLGISVNAGAFDTVALPGGIFDGNAQLHIGASAQAGSPRYWNGRLDAGYFGKLASGGLSVALAAEIAAYLYNGGAGREYPEGWT